MERTEPPLIAAERDMLAGWLDYHRGTLRSKCEGLNDDQLRLRSVPPSTMSLLGLVRHCTEVEQYWWRTVVEQQQVTAPYCSDAHPDGDFDLVDDASVEEAFASWSSECAHGDEVLATRDLEATVPRHGQQMSLRWVLSHLVEEYARHNGHADLLRQCVDGATGE